MQPAARSNSPSASILQKVEEATRERLLGPPVPGTRGESGPALHQEAERRLGQGPLT